MESNLRYQFGRLRLYQGASVAALSTNFSVNKGQRLGAGGGSQNRHE